MVDNSTTTRCKDDDDAAASMPATNLTTTMTWPREILNTDNPSPPLRGDAHDNAAAAGALRQRGPACDPNHDDLQPRATSTTAHRHL